jgi:hypothetical protein
VSPIFPRDFQRTVLFASGLTLVSPLRDCHLLWCRIPADFVLRRSGVPEPHISMQFPARIRLALFPFRSPLLRESLLLSFPLPTKMLQFGRLPFAKANEPEGSGGPIRQSPVQRLLAPTRSNIAAWHDLHRLPSRVIPHQGCSNPTEVVRYGHFLGPESTPYLVQAAYARRFASTAFIGVPVTPCGAVVSPHPKWGASAIPCATSSVAELRARSESGRPAGTAPRDSKSLRCPVGPRLAFS